ncbi:MAG TPA: hypothetical protein VG276_27970 [Actinomycetes bacterium]|jgi:hypothetical protein|nr:hypothetical protein [Actinomycetes bacterium]
MSELLEGEVIVRREADGRVVVEQAPPIARMSLALLASADQVTIRVSGDRLVLGGQVVYRVTGWDQQSHALLLERVPGLTNAEAAAEAWPAGFGTKGA